MTDPKPLEKSMKLKNLGHPFKPEAFEMHKNKTTAKEKTTDYFPTFKVYAEILPYSFNHALRHCGLTWNVFVSLQLDYL